MEYHKEVYYGHLFVIYINDLPDQVKWDIFLFGENTKLCIYIKEPDGQSILQDDVYNMMKLVHYWQLEVYPDKCVKLSINNKKGLNRI